nr:NADH dehydrogenase subunit 1 [Tylorrhynchus heterochaetus]
MLFSSLSLTLVTYVTTLIAMAFFTLLERKILGYIQLRKGPNKVSLSGIPQPFADAVKLFTKELNKPTLANTLPFIFAPTMGLFLALIMWILYPHSINPLFMKWGILLFLCISSMNVYTTLISGWSSNSKYSLLGALRSIAQTISYEVSMALIILTPLMIMYSLSFNIYFYNQVTPSILVMWPIAIIWFISCLAETNRTPFDLAEGESELVSGFNTEYSSGTFALIFMAEYTNILVMSMLTAALFFTCSPIELLKDFSMIIMTMILSIMFLWARGAFPRMRYDKLMALTWKQFLPASIM